MTNTSAVSVTRNQNTSHSTALRLSSDIDDVIGKIGSLQLSRDREANSRRSAIGSREETDPNIREPLDADESKIDQRVLSENESGSGGGGDDDDDDDDDDDNEGKLIERAPVKSKFASPIRNRPYSINEQHSWLLPANENYDKCQEDNRQYTDNNFCLNFTDTDNNCSDDLVLFQRLLDGNFQQAQTVTKTSFPDTLQTNFELSPGNAIVSGSESHESSPTHSSTSTTYMEPPGTVKPNFTHNSASSPQVCVASTCRLAAPSSYSPSCSPSSSNLSYTDKSSPGSLYQTAVGSQTSNKLAEQWNIANNSVWANQLVKNTLEKSEEDLSSFSKTEDPSYLLALLDCISTLHFNGATSNEFPIENAPIGETLPLVEASYSSQTCISQKETQGVETVNSIRPHCTVNVSLFANYPNDLFSMLNSFGDSSSIDDTITRVELDDFETGRTTAIMRNCDDLEIPEVVASREFAPRQRCNSDGNAIPWPWLKLPSVRASEKLKEHLNPREVKKAMISLLKRSPKELANQDKDGDTVLMCLVGNPDELVRKMAYLVPLVERLGTIGGALTATNVRGEDALYLAAHNCQQYPFVAGYLAAAMLDKGINVNQRFYDTRGNTLIHSIVAHGDSHAEVLAELLDLGTTEGNTAFQVSKCNRDGKTALHVAIESHDPFTKGIVSTAIVKILFKYGADPRIKETKRGYNALHVAVSFSCDPALVKLLLDNCAAADLVNATNYNHDTPLHMATTMSGNVPLHRREEVCRLLTNAGGHRNFINNQGQTETECQRNLDNSAIHQYLFDTFE